MARKKSLSARARAFRDWMAANGANTSQVAAKAGVSYTTLASFVQGDTQSLKGANEEKIAAAFGATAAEIFGGAESSVRRIPIIGWAAAGKLADPEAQLPAESETIEIGGLEPGDYFATRANGDSMNRIAADGALLVVNRADREPIRGRRYIFAHRGKTTFKRYADGPVRLEPESLNPEHEPIFPKDGETWHVLGRVRLVVNEL